MFYEIEIFYEKYGVRYFFWVDVIWNVDVEWLDEYCEGILKCGYKLGWWVFIWLD